MATHEHNLSKDELRKKETRKVLYVAGILSVVTILEFALALNWPESLNRGILVSLMVILTLVKAFYIIADFMHLKYEVKMLAWSIVIPLVFIIWLVAALLIESDSIFLTR